MIIRKLIN